MAGLDTNLHITPDRILDFIRDRIVNNKLISCHFDCTITHGCKSDVTARASL